MAPGMQIFIEGSLTVIVVLKEEAPKQMGPGATAKSKQGFVSEKKGAHSESLTTETVMLWGGRVRTFNPSMLKAEASVAL